MADSAPLKAFYKGVEFDFLITSFHVLDSLKCVLCTGLVCEPVETSCAHQLCGNCSGKQKSCPKCHKKLNSPLDKATREAIARLKVKCPNSVEGCEWQGDLGDAEEHLEEKCQHQKVECPNGCSEDVERRLVAAHMKQKCSNRVRKCIHRDPKGNVVKVTSSHVVLCGDFPLNCPAGCGEVVVRKDMQDHLSTKCPEEYVSCKFMINGCTKVLKRKELERHESDDRFHFQVMMQSQTVLFKSLIPFFQSPTYTRPDVTSLPLSFRPWLQNTPTCYPRPPWVVKLEGFEEKKKGSKHWTCVPVHSHFGGYKMCLRIDASTNNDGSGPYVSAYVSLMKGENDDNLKFPYKGRIVVSMLNQLEDRGHHTRVVWGPEFNISPAASHRVTEGKRADCGWGIFNFIPHKELDYDELSKTLYLSNDCVFIRIDRFDPLL